MAEQHHACTAIVFCNSCTTTTTAHIYDEEGTYMYSISVDVAFCNGGTSPVVYNVGAPAVNGGGGPRRPTRHCVTSSAC